jgi:hypothetical protein
MQVERDERRHSKDRERNVDERDFTNVFFLNIGSTMAHTMERTAVVSIPLLYPTGEVRVHSSCCEGSGPRTDAAKLVEHQCPSGKTVF